MRDGDLRQTPVKKLVIKMKIGARFTTNPNHVTLNKPNLTFQSLNSVYVVIETEY